jgi:hypothetical protein
MNAPDDFRIGSVNPGHQPAGDHVPAAFEFTSGGGDPGMGCRDTGTVVARVLPEFATRQVVTCNDNWSRPTIIIVRPPSPLAVLTSSGRNRPSRVIPPILLRRMGS